VYDWDSFGSSESLYITFDDVREILNRASFFWQHYAKTFNTAFKIEVPLSESRSEGDALQSVAAFARALERNYAFGDAMFASVNHVERAGSIVVGRIVAYVQDDIAREHSFAEFIGKSTAADIVVDVMTIAGSDPRKFQWHQVLELCAGFDGSAETEDLLALLRIARNRRRSPQPVSGCMVLFSPLLSKGAIEQACEYGMYPLSAFDSKAWKWIARGWEAQEHNDRAIEIVARKRKVHNLTSRLRLEPEKLEAEMASLLGSWQSLKPEDRTREFFVPGWWHQCST
jgi:DNA polymerase-3 subunit gamma/tau